MMRNRGRWDDCVQHWGDAAIAFVQDFFTDADRKVILVCGGGFDPRSRIVADHVADACAKDTHCVILREDVPLTDDTLVKRADDNTNAIQARFDNHQVERINMVSGDQAVTGGRTAVQRVQKHLESGTTDLIVDFSAMSIGVAFPLVRLLLEYAEQKPRGQTVNLHLFAIDEPLTDGAITSIASDRATPVHGFGGQLGLDASRGAAKLWLPQLGLGESVPEVLGRVYNWLEPDAVCPVIPFAPSRPRLGDDLIWAFRDEFESTWQVDSRDIVYAHDSYPLDLYRTILRIDDIRQQVFRDVGGSMTILSPFGRKMLAIGAMLAAIDRDFPVVRSEAVGYRMDQDKIDDAGQVRMVHLWLHGEAYPQDNSKEADQ